MHNLLETSAKSPINLDDGGDLLAPPGTTFLGGFRVLDFVREALFERGL